MPLGPLFQLFRDIFLQIPHYELSHAYPFLDDITISQGEGNPELRGLTAFPWPVGAYGPTLDRYSQ
jgi:hypothetical protein